MEDRSINVEHFPAVFHALESLPTAAVQPTTQHTRAKCKQCIAVFVCR